MLFEIITEDQIVRSNGGGRPGVPAKRFNLPVNYRKVQVPERVAKKGCAECGANVKTYLCRACVLLTDIRIKHGIGVASDYALGKDYLTNCVAFLHACGQLENFFDKVHSEPEVMFSVEARPFNCISAKDVEDIIECGDSFEETMQRNLAAFKVKSPRRTFGPNKSEER